MVPSMFRAFRAPSMNGPPPGLESLQTARCDVTPPFRWPSPPLVYSITTSFFALLLTLVFFPLSSQGSSAFGDCCSKCFIEMQKKQGIAPAAPKPEPKLAEPEPMEEPTVVSSEPEAAVVEETELVVAALAVDEQQKKKKKTSYKNMLKDMMKSSPERDLEKEKEQLRQVTGGGQFQKIEKI